MKFQPETLHYGGECFLCVCAHDVAFMHTIIHAIFLHALVFFFQAWRGKLLSFSTSLYLAMVMGTSILDDAGQGYLSESWFCELSSYKRAIFKLKPMFFLNSYSRRVSSSRVSSRKLRSCRTNLYAVMETAAWKYWGFAASVIDSLSMPTFR